MNDTETRVMTRLLEIIPVEAFEELLAVCEHGEPKHGDDWKRSTPAIYYDAASAHIDRRLYGELPEDVFTDISDIDPEIEEEESGLLHGAHAAARCLFAVAMEKRGKR